MRKATVATKKKANEYDCLQRSFLTRNERLGQVIEENSFSPAAKRVLSEYRNRANPDAM